MTVNRRATVWIIVLTALLIVRGLAQAHVPLMHQEAYYWMYTQHPSLSYYDHPPMVAWVISLGTTLFGDGEFGVRSIGGMLMVANCGLIYAFARVWWGKFVAGASALLVGLLPVYFGIGFLATMDAPLLTFWLLSMLGFSIAVRQGRTWGWYLCGFGFGGALLSKYTGIFLVPGVGLCLLLHRPWRRHILSPHPYVAVLLGVLMFGPVLIWNYQNDWASFRFQFFSRFDVGETSHAHPMLEFIGQQIGVATPVVLGSFVLVLGRGARRRRLSGREIMALAFSVPLLLSMAKKGWDYPVHINWTAPGYLAFMPAAFQAARVRVRAGQVWPKWAWRAGVALPTLAACAVVNFGLMGYLLVEQPRTHAMRLFGPWNDIAAVVEHYEDDLERRTGREPFVIVDGKYELPSLIAFYRNRIAPQDVPAKSTVNQFAIGDTPLGYAYWTNKKSWIGRDFVFVDDDPNPVARIGPRFKSATVVWTGKAANGKTYNITECLDYREPSADENRKTAQAQHGG